MGLTYEKKPTSPLAYTSLQFMTKQQCLSRLDLLFYNEDTLKVTELNWICIKQTL